MKKNTSYSSPAADLQEIFKCIVGEILAKKLFCINEIPDRAWVVHSKVKGKYRGDIASEISFSLAKLLRCSPMEAGEKIAQALREQTQYCEFVDVIAPGFINVGLKNDYLKQKMLLLFRLFQGKKIFPIVKRDDQNKSNDSKLLFEYVSANPTGPLHVGHGRWAVVGNVLCRILKAVRGDVFEEFYVNDAGNQIAAFLQSVENIRQGKAVAEDGYHGDYLLSFKDNSLDVVKALLAQQKKELEGISVFFDCFFHEKDLRNSGKIEKLLQFLQKCGLAYEKEGALWFSSTVGGDDKDRVLIKSDGRYTYFAVDIAYHFTKMERGFFHLVNLLGADHHGYVKRITIATQLIYEKFFATKDGVSSPSLIIKILIGQQVMLFRSGIPVKMSKRTGDIVTLREVLQEVGVDAFRYFMCAQSTTQRIDFDLTRAKEKTMENPVFYLQYAHVRCCSIFEKAKNFDLTACDVEKFDSSLFDQAGLRLIINEILHFSEVLLNISRSLEVHHFPRFLYDLSALFHSLYAHLRFVDASSPQKIEQTKQYLFFIDFFRCFLRENFQLMGVSAPEKM